MNEYLSYAIGLDHGIRAGLEKLGWFGTYYYGGSPKAERAALREGLRTDNPKLYRSRTLAKLEGGMENPRVVSQLRKLSPRIERALLKARASNSGSFNDAMRTLKSGLEPHKKLILQIAGDAAGSTFKHQPLEIHGLSSLKPAVDIPAESIRRGTPSLAGRGLSRLLKLFRK